MRSAVSIGQSAIALGVSVSTLRCWEAAGYFKASFRTKGGHRRYHLADIQSNLLAMSGKTQPDASANKKVVGYCRVLSHGQTEDLKRQEKDLSEFCTNSGQQFEIISDCGSGINYRKRGLTRLIRMILRGEVKTLVLTHRDRLLRFGSQLLFQICEYFEVRVIILHEQETEDFEKQLATDLIEIITVFTSRVYGRRAQENRKRRLTA